ncbi:hypothetical protein P171DRAFT_515380 [Karstenula rhodostoma CBS 690.94]|uniref:Uncharacterized protein n=1 Tax=Karstenula rhodostoma CBS 690.94 TaxID=1392251 RepID=A0A9P4PYT6_9PLEO|nr:hypothetical protein P171DRAFT_515380 [Karstenula rhodostoma CBS 690.94]
MPPIDMWDWLRSIPEKTCSSQDSSFSSPAQQLHYKTFSELHEYALKHAKATYKALPHPLLLRFEHVDQDKLALFPKNADVTESRLLVGLSKHSYKGQFIPAYAYICRKNQLHQVLLRLGSKHLKAKDFEDVEWEKPFDSIYDAYGQTERAGDKICIMAAFYFLATERIPQITTRINSFMQNFTKLCDKIHVQDTNEVASYVITTPKLVGDPEKDQSPPSGPLSRPFRAQSNQAVSEAQQQKVDRKEELAGEVFGTRQDTSDTQLIAVMYRIDDKGDRSTISPINDLSSRISSLTVCDGSSGLPMDSLPRNNVDLLLDVAIGQEKPQVKPHNHAEDGQPAISEKKVLNIDDLAAFVSKFRELEAENAQHQQHEVAVADLQLLVVQSQNDAKQAYTNLQGLQERFQNQETEMEELRKDLARTKTDSTHAYQKLTHDLAQEKRKLQLAQHMRDQTQTRLDNAQAEKERLEQRLEKVEQNGASRQKLAAIEANLEVLEADRKGMQDRINFLEGEVQEERNKFNDYKRKIRNLSLDP